MLAFDILPLSLCLAGCEKEVRRPYRLRKSRTLPAKPDDWKIPAFAREIKNVSSQL